eukprot:SAG31_NODE_38_length_31498_cov_41.930539_2_plen_115_part_00
MLGTSSCVVDCCSLLCGGAAPSSVVIVLVPVSDGASAGGSWMGRCAAVEPDCSCPTEPDVLMCGKVTSPTARPYCEDEGAEVGRRPLAFCAFRSFALTSGELMLLYGESFPNGI